MRRGKKKPPTEFASLETVKEYAQTSSIPSLHSARSAGITAMDVDSTGNFILTGGNDKHVQLYSKSEDKVVVNLPGHTKKITAVKFRGQEESDLLLSASADKHVRIWIPDEKKGMRVYVCLCFEVGLTLISLSLQAWSQHYCTQG